MKTGGSGPPRRVSLHRILAWRLGVVALIIAAAAGAGVYQIERNRIGEAIEKDLLEAAERITARITPMLDRPEGPDRLAIENVLVEFGKTRDRERLGRWVYDILLDSRGRVAFGYLDEDYERALAVTRIMTDRPVTVPPPPGEVRMDVIRIDSIPHVEVELSLAGPGQKPLGLYRGLFVPSPAMLAQLRERTVRAMFSVVIVVLLTAALLYPVIITLTRRVAGLSVDLLDANLETLKILGSAIAKRDNDTDAHNFRVTVLAVRLAEAVGLSPKEIRSLIKGAFLHDVGKIAIRDDILLKPDHLTEEEYRTMKTHVSHGVDIVRRSSWLNDAIEVVSCHHEKFDGSGYPAGSQADGIPLNARIFSIADVFDALTSRRPYKEPFSFEKSMSILEEGRGTHFDPTLLDAFSCIAGPLSRDLNAGAEDTPRRELVKIIRTYFSGDVDRIA